MSNIPGEPLPGASPLEAIKPKPQLDKGVGIVTNPPLTPEVKLDAEQVKKELIDPRTISKKTDQEGRTETARAILEVRANTRTAKADIAENEQRLQQIAELTSASYQLERQKNDELTRRLESLVVKVKGLVGIGDKQAAELQTEIDAIKSEREALYTQSYKVEDEVKSLRERQAELPNPKELLDAYYEKVSSQPLSNEQKRELLKPEVLSNLSTEEYIALWKRLNPYFLTHVTRQGFRDHNAMFYHSAGLQEFHNGFLGVIEDDKMLRPPLALHGLRARDEASVKNYLDSWVLQAEDGKEAKKKTQ